jgi:hypothetical protein
MLLLGLFIFFVVIHPHFNTPYVNFKLTNGILPPINLFDKI